MRKIQPVTGGFGVCPAYHEEVLPMTVMERLANSVVVPVVVLDKVEDAVPTYLQVQHNRVEATVTEDTPLEKIVGLLEKIGFSF